MFHVKQREYPVRLGQVLDLAITGYTSEGQGVGRVEGLAVFVAGAIRGETVRVKIAHLGHTAAYGDILEVLTPSPHRVEPGCPSAARCGGCVFWHMDYEEELQAKAQRVGDALNRIGGCDLEGVDIVPSPQVTGYRNKAQYPVGGIAGRPVAGFFAPRSHRVVDVGRCRIQGSAADRAKEAVLKWMKKSGAGVYDERAHRGLVRHIYVRAAAVTKQVLVCLVVNGDLIPQESTLVENLLTSVENLHTVCLSIHTRRGNAVLGDRFRTLYGPGYSEERLCGLTFRLSPRSFYQVNHDQAEQLYEGALAMAELTGQERAVDLYCGTGTISLVLAGQVKEVIGVEIIEAAVADARENARRNGVENAAFRCADAGQAARELAAEGKKPDVIVVDPPRKGLDEAVIEAMAEMGPEKIVYISCDPATLARDVKRLREKGYALTAARAYDMFPRCAHVETAAVLQRSFR